MCLQKGCLITQSPRSFPALTLCFTLLLGPLVLSLRACSPRWRAVTWSPCISVTRVDGHSSQGVILNLFTTCWQNTSCQRLCRPSGAFSLFISGRIRVGGPGGHPPSCDIWQVEARTRAPLPATVMQRAIPAGSPCLPSAWAAAALPPPTPLSNVLPAGMHMDTWGAGLSASGKWLFL